MCKISDGRPRKQETGTAGGPLSKAEEPPSCCMIVQSEAARQSGCELVQVRQSVSTRKEQFVARVVVVVKRRNITALPHGEAANLRPDLSPHRSLGLFGHASSAFVSAASTSLSGVRLGLPDLLGERRSQAGGVKSVRRGHHGSTSRFR